MISYKLKLSLAGVLAMSMSMVATAKTVSHELKPGVRNAVENTRNLVKGNKKTVTPFKSNYSGLLQAPSHKENSVKEAKAASNLPTIYGSMLYNDAWYNLPNGTAYPVGYYGIQPTPGAKFQEIALHPNLEVNGGGCYSDHKIHYHLWELYTDENSETGIVFNDYYCVVNTDIWSFVNTPTSNSETDAYIAYDMTYDPVTKNIYAAQWGYYEDTYCNLAVVNPATGESNDIARMPAMSVLASNNFGQLFGVASDDGMAYYIDKTTGALIPLGSTGVSPKYAQSATVDPATNTIYWAASLADETGVLYTIDTTTGAVTKVMDMPGNAELTGLFIEADYAGLNAPAQLEDLILTSSGNTANISYTIPSKGFDGSALTGSINTYVYVDGKLAFSQAGTPGQAVTGSFAVTSGSHTIVAYASNSVGDGMKTYRIQTTGKDVPAAPGNVVLTVNGGKANLTWTAPTQGMNGGEFDPLTLTYTIVRYPGATTVAMAYKDTSFAETLPAGTATYYYEVTAYADGEKGGTGRSNAEFVGTAFTVPYSQDFEDPNSLDGFTIINNEEGRGWYRWENTALNFKAAASKFNMNIQCNNWLILPTILLEGGKDYYLNFKARVFFEEDPEKFEVTIGNTATPEAQTQVIMPVKTIANEEWMDYNLPFKVNADGTYNIAFHHVSPAKAYYLIIDDISVTETSLFVDTPLPVTNLKAVAEGDNAVVSWTAPTKGVNGDTLDPEKLSYEIYDSYGLLLASNFKGTSFVDDRSTGAEKQVFIYYQVTPIHGEKRGESSLTDFLILGPDYSVPFKESFAGAGLDNTPWALSTLAGNNTGTWALAASSDHPATEAYDGDGGMSVFLGYSLPRGSKGRLTSPKVDLLSATHPVLSFYVYKTGAQGNETLDVEISHNDFNFVKLASVNLKDGTGWQRVEIEIPRAQCKEESMISFTATSGYGMDICLDNITITEDGTAAPGTDLQAVDIEMPDEMMPDVEKEFKVTIFNNGTTTVNEYTVSLLVNDQIANSAKNSEPIEPGETYIYIFKATAEEEDMMQTFRFAGQVKCDGDINPDNDTTEAKAITVGIPAGVNDVEAGGGISVTAANGALLITGAEGLTARIYTVDGRLVESVVCAEATSVTLEHGFYIVTVKNKIEKIRL